ncbi:MAG: hypothetical protein PHW82_06850, partial [Bacteroidales bacterium]|nr:hypothetical protein [Bacteroidales bacterium]
MRKQLLLYFILFSSFGFLSAQIPLDDLNAWYIGDSVIITSGAVSQLYDLSTNGYHLTHGTAINRPLQITNAINNHSIIRFDGSNDNLFRDLGQTFSQPITVFIVWKNSKVTGTSPPLYFIDGTNFIRIRSQLGGRVSLDAGASQINYVKDQAFSDFIVTSGLFNTTDSKLYENGILQQSGVLTNMGYSRITLGFGGSWYFGGDIAEVIVYSTAMSDEDRQSVENYLMDKYTPSFDLGPDIVVDYGFCDTLLTVNSEFLNILWSTGETNDSIYVNSTATYFVQANDIFGRLHFDTINVVFPEIGFSNSTICLGDSILYNPDLTGSYSYLWSDLTTDASKYFKDEGDYWLRIEDDNSCFDTVFFSVDVDSFKNKIWLGNDTSLCSGNTIQLINGEEQCSSHLWSPGGNTAPVQTVSSTGWQKLEVANSFGCTVVDSIYVTIIGTAPIPDYTIENLCFGDTTQFIDNSTPSVDISSWKWIINENDTLYTQNAEWLFETTGLQQIELIVASFSGCFNSISFEIEILEIPTVSYTHLPACSGTELIFNPIVDIPTGLSINNYNWYIDGIPVSNNEVLSYTFSNSNFYLVGLQVAADNGCYGVYKENISVEEQYEIPDFVSLVSPANDYCLSDSVISFQWNYDTNAIYYELLLASDSLFMNTFFSIQNLEFNNYSYNNISLFDTIFWKVNAFNPCLETFTSETRTVKYFSPKNIDSLLIWLPAHSNTNNANNVSSWLDLSSNSFELGQTDINKQPTLIDSVFNNLPIVSFDGINDNLFLDLIDSRTTPISIFILWKNTKNSGTSPPIYCNHGADILRLRSQLGGSLSIDANTSSVVYSKDQLFSNFIITTGYFDEANSKIWENGTFKSSGSLTNVNLSNINVGYAGSWHFGGDIAEIIFYDTVLNDTDRQMVERYLHDKYSPPVNLSFDIRSISFCDTAITTAYKPWFTAYEWSTGETDSIIHVNRPGLYSVTVTDIFGFESS